MAVCSANTYSDYYGYSQQQALQQLGGLGQQAKYFPPLSLLPTPQKKGKRTMFTEVKDAIREFFVEHKQTIIWIAVLFLVDKFMFAGKFTTKLHALIDGMIEKIETKVKGAL